MVETEKQFIEDPSEGLGDPFMDGNPLGDDLILLDESAIETNFKVDEDVKVVVDELGPAPAQQTEFGSLESEPDILALEGLDDGIDVTGNDYPEPFEDDTSGFPKLDDGTLEDPVGEVEGELDFNIGARKRKLVRFNS